MDYKPRFVQPFTFREAVALDVPTITDGCLLIFLDNSNLPI